MSAQPLLKSFHSLQDNEQELLLALSVIYAPINQTELKNLLLSIGLDTRYLHSEFRNKTQRFKLTIATADGWVCNRDVAEQLTRLAINKPWFAKLAQLLIADERESVYFYRPQYALQQRIKKCRIFLYQGNETGFLANFARLRADAYQASVDVINRLFFYEFNETWFASLSEPIRFLALQAYLDCYSWQLADSSLQYGLLEKLITDMENAPQEMLHCVAEQRLWRGNETQLETWLIHDNSVMGLQLLATLRFFHGQYDEALQLFTSALQALKKETGKRAIALSDIYGYFYALTLLQTRTPSNLQLLKKQHIPAVLKDYQAPFHKLTESLAHVVDVLLGKRQVDTAFYCLLNSNTEPYECLFRLLLPYWLLDAEQQLSDDKASKVFLSSLSGHCRNAQKLGYVWYAAVSAHLLERLGYHHNDSQQIARYYENTPYSQIIDLLPKVSAWERALDALSRLHIEPASHDEVQPELRLVWAIDLSYGALQIEPKEQRLSKSGKWSKGRNIALKRLYHELKDFGYLSEQDKRICKKIVIDRDADSYYYREAYVLPEEAALDLVGHPAVFWAQQVQYDVPLDIRLAEPQLLVTQKSDKLHVELMPQINGESRIVIQKTANGLLLYAINEQHRQVAAILGSDGLTIPASAKQRVIDSIASIASTLTVQSDIGGSSQHAETVPVDSRLHIHLQPIGQGLQIEAFVQPFHAGGPLYKPAEGGTTVLADVDGKHLQTTRVFAEEKRYLKQLFENCPELYKDKELKWLMDVPDLALEALLNLQELGDFAVLEWPKGKKVKLSREMGLSQARFSVRQERDWFSVEGDLVIDDDNVLSMQRLMALLGNSTGRFLQLEDGQIITLTKELRRRLDDLAGLGDVQKDGVHFHPLAAQALDEITEGMTITASKPWQDQLKRLNELGDLQPKVPSTLQGELRDYQHEGFQWLSRLAHWGAGACLADDMGLGKTVQALALILSRAPQGASLILAPTSVCINWLEEAARFAPTLNVQQFGTGDRQAMLDNAGAFDLIICSYGLLQTEIDRLGAVQWHTLVADEAQAIKNTLTKRSKAAMALQADFKMITTGTPIENHLGELWNLFNFINPGLLGSLTRFNERYASAIENQHDHAVQQRLKKLLRPFILRRLKNDVLTELPARTEVTLHIELSADERAFYEALRRSALQVMTEAANQSGGHNQLKILAEIMRLRRACCNTRLVMEDSMIPSSKLQAFDELVTELLENRHKALVFSQFVGHLSLIRELLDSKGISYHYLDGATPPAQRKKAMNAFQAGDGDLFLISLKAGGTGLNLTAADYVIHMDPWWNPAVEDQASDRAHRMGQKRPVTIYRLVAKDTIEDKIVDLHRHKRDLANSLLEGGDISGKLSVDDMLALLRDID